MFGRKDAGLAEANLLELRPVRTAGWSEVPAGTALGAKADAGTEVDAGAEPAAEPRAETGADARVVVERELPPTRGVTGWLRRLSFLTGVKKLRLDALGTAAWRRIDGSRTVAEVVDELRREFGDGCEPAEERLGMFLGLLRRERLIGYPGWDDERIAAWKQRP